MAKFVGSQAASNDTAEVWIPTGNSRLSAARGRPAAMSIPLGTECMPPLVAMGATTATKILGVITVGRAEVGMPFPASNAFMSLS